MTPAEIWQNFQLGTEQEIACNFIYDGLRNLHEMETLGLDSEIFLVMYNLSVGIERMFKVAIVLLEFNNNTNVNDFEKSLITHNHLELLNRIKEKQKLSLGDVHIGLLSLLSTFYKTYRYDRFSLQSVANLSKDKKALYDFLNKHLHLDIKDDSPLFYVENSIRIKKFIGETVKKITREIHSIIKDSASSKNLNTYEISSSYSKASKILLGDGSVTFEDEDIATMEALIFLMNTGESSLVDFIKDIEPLPLDPALSSEYLQCVLHKNPSIVQGVIDEVEDRYREVTNLKDRLEMIKIIKDPSLSICL